jgi:hypothetical protein
LSIGQKSINIIRGAYAFILCAAAAIFAEIIGSMGFRLFEFEDCSWFPDSIRKGGTDYLKFFLKTVGFYKPVIPLIERTLIKAGVNNIIDLCSGAGGPMEQINEGLHKKAINTVTITLTDKFPNTEAYQYIEQKSNGSIRFKAFPVDAACVPPDMTGLRTMFSAIHHFEPEAVKQVLKDAVAHKAGIALFDGGDKNIFTILGIILFHPVAFLIFTPFFRPFKLSRLLFTYIIPLIPLTTVWDGCVSILRLYTPEALLSLAKEVSGDAYIWEAGKIRNRAGMHIAYLIGYPAGSQ